MIPGHAVALKDMITPAMPVKMQQATNGFLYLSVTPYTPGSVMPPRIAENAALPATSLTLTFLVLRNTATQAPIVAKLQATVIGEKESPPSVEIC